MDVPSVNRTPVTYQDSDEEDEEDDSSDEADIPYYPAKQMFGVGGIDSSLYNRNSSPYGVEVRNSAGMLIAQRQIHPIIEDDEATGTSSSVQSTAARSVSTTGASSTPAPANSNELLLPQENMESNSSASGSTDQLNKSKDFPILPEPDLSLYVLSSNTSGTGVAYGNFPSAGASKMEEPLSPRSAALLVAAEAKRKEGQDLLEFKSSNKIYGSENLANASAPSEVQTNTGGSSGWWQRQAAAMSFPVMSTIGREGDASDSIPSQDYHQERTSKTPFFVTAPSDESLAFADSDISLSLKESSYSITAQEKADLGDDEHVNKNKQPSTLSQKSISFPEILSRDSDSRETLARSGEMQNGSTTTLISDILKELRQVSKFVKDYEASRSRGPTVETNTDYGNDNDDVVEDADRRGVLGATSHAALSSDSTDIQRQGRAVVATPKSSSIPIIRSSVRVSPSKSTFMMAPSDESQGTSGNKVLIEDKSESFSASPKGTYRDKKIRSQDRAKSKGRNYASRKLGGGVSDVRSDEINTSGRDDALSLTYTKSSETFEEPASLRLPSSSVGRSRDRLGIVPFSYQKKKNKTKLAAKAPHKPFTPLYEPPSISRDREDFSEVSWGAKRGAKAGTSKREPFAKSNLIDSDEADVSLGGVIFSAAGLSRTGYKKSASAPSTPSRDAHNDFLDQENVSSSAPLSPLSRRQSSRQNSKKKKLPSLLSALRRSSNMLDIEGENNSTRNAAASNVETSGDLSVVSTIPLYEGKSSGLGSSLSPRLAYPTEPVTTPPNSGEPVGQRNKQAEGRGREGNIGDYTSGDESSKTRSRERISYLEKKTSTNKPIYPPNESWQYTS